MRKMKIQNKIKYDQGHRNESNGHQNECIFKFFQLILASNIYSAWIKISPLEVSGV